MKYSINVDKEQLIKLHFGDVLDYDDFPKNNRAKTKSQDAFKATYHGR